MKINIGPYRTWIGPYQLADLLKKFGLSEEKADKFGDWLSERPLVTKFTNWLHDVRPRTVKVRIDRYDTWSMDSTLAVIILPMLKQLKATQHGAPHVDDEDVPYELRSIVADIPADDHIDSNHFKRWEYVLDEMIFAFEQKCKDDWSEHFYDTSSVDRSLPFEQQIKSMKVDRDGMQAMQHRISNGFRLFGKYYEGLWD